MFDPGDAAEMPEGEAAEVAQRLLLLSRMETAKRIQQALEPILTRWGADAAGRFVSPHPLDRELITSAIVGALPYPMLSYRREGH